MKDERKCGALQIPFVISHDGGSNDGGSNDDGSICQTPRSGLKKTRLGCRLKPEDGVLINGH